MCLYISVALKYVLKFQFDKRYLLCLTREGIILFHNLNLVPKSFGVSSTDFNSVVSLVSFVCYSKVLPLLVFRISIFKGYQVIISILVYFYFMTGS